MKVRVQEYRDRIFELPDNHFEDKDGDYFDDLSDCEIANEFKTKDMSNKIKEKNDELRAIESLINKGKIAAKTLGEEELKSWLL